VENKIWVRAIHPDSEIIRKVTADNEKYLRKSKYVKDPAFDMSIEITLYGKSKVGIMSYPEDIAMIIESEKVYKSLQSIFDVMWVGLPES
jgi:hypothetical protein